MRTIHNPYTRVISSAAAFFSVLAFSLFVGVPFAHARTPVHEVRLDEATIVRGYTATESTGVFSIGITPGAVDRPVWVRMETVGDDEVGPSPEGMTRVSPAYGIDIVHADGSDAVPLSRPLWLKVKYPRTDYSEKQFMFWDAVQNKWRPFHSRELVGSDTVQGQITLPYFQFAVFTKPNINAGYASWYNYSTAALRTKYAHGAATNLYPVGTKLTVTNLDNGKSVDVTVVSTWSDAGKLENRRIIDLVLHSFNHIGASTQGTMPVRIAPASGGSDTSSDTSLHPVPTTGALKSHSVYVTDDTGTVSLNTNAGEVRSLASITKLITALVVLDTNPNFDAVVTYHDSDNAEGAHLNVTEGETMTVQDLWYSGLTGSANNAINALARSTGLSRSDFVARMNAKVKGMGLTHTVFTDPTGLDVTNVSTAKEIAVFARVALANRTIAHALTARTYAFATINTHKGHTITNRDELIGKGYPIVGGKTGYLVEAGYCIAILAKRADGQAVMIVLLGAPSSSSRFSDAAQLLNTYTK